MVLEEIGDTLHTTLDLSGVLAVVVEEHFRVLDVLYRRRLSHSVLRVQSNQESTSVHTVKAAIEPLLDAC